MITQKDENVKNNCYVKVRSTFTTAMAILGSMNRMPLFIQDTDQTCRLVDHNGRPQFFIWRPYCPAHLHTRNHTTQNSFENMIALFTVI